MRSKGVIRSLSILFFVIWFSAAYADHVLWHDRPAADDIDVGWQQQSFPLGNGWFGVSVHGGPEREHLVLTDNAVLTRRNLTKALDVYLELEPPPRWEGPVKYRRELNLERGRVAVSFTRAGIDFRREYVTSYPDRVLAIRLTASKPRELGFSLRADVPYVETSTEGYRAGIARTGKVRVADDTLDVTEHLDWYNIHFFGRFRVVHDGVSQAVGERLVVRDATEATVFFSCGNNYRLQTENFFAAAGEWSDEPLETKLPDDFTHEAETKARVDAAVRKGWAGVVRDHEADLARTLGRVSLDLDADPADAARPTDELLKACGEGRVSRWLEETYFQYGRYLLVSSSRPGTLPANLQGAWTGWLHSPWGCGYWHNINVQMNYWPAFNTNLAECFEPYARFNAAFRPQTRDYAFGYLKEHGLDATPGKDGDPDIWCVGTPVWPYVLGGAPGKHSGPGTVGLTTKLFADWYDFTRDREALVRYVWPTLHGAANFLSRCVVETNGLYLSKFSASPEQIVENGKPWSWTTGGPPYYHTVGCAFDQQMIDENARDFVRLAEILGTNDAVVATVRAQLGKYDPVQVGESGQLKEYREERRYGEIGEYNHRHISQLVGLYPGTIVNKAHPDWMAAARYTLNERGDESTGWALAHRLNAWARLGDGDRCRKLLTNLLGKRTYANLWDAHPPFQIDGNFGATAGMAEMLVQSHAGFVDLLPALPAAWSKRGSFRGLCVRGGWEIDCSWRDGRPVSVELRPGPHAGPQPEVRFQGAPVAVPHLTGLNPDPSICRVGDDYYLVTSSFALNPGLPVYHSRDLANWTVVSHAWTPPEGERLEVADDDGGCWAPTIREKDGVFYITVAYSGKKGFGNYVMTAKKSEGPWSPPVRIEGADGVDPSLFFDTDGRCYYVGNTWANTNEVGVWAQEFDPKALRLVGERHFLSRGARHNRCYVEAPHLYRVGGRYWLLAAQGGVGPDHCEVALCADAVFGPYREAAHNPVLSQGNAVGVVGPGHADLVQTPQGDWFGCFLAERPVEGANGLLGRETFLCPVEWSEDGPRFRLERCCAGNWTDATSYSLLTRPDWKVRFRKVRSLVAHEEFALNAGEALFVYRSERGCHSTGPVNAPRAVSADIAPEGVRFSTDGSHECVRDAKPLLSGRPGQRFGGLLVGAGAPAPFGRPVPSAALRARLQAEEDVIGIVHWGLNTYTDREWGYGDENPWDLNPAKFDAAQIAKACADGGLRGLVVVAKHHDGFCLWPTKTTDHNIGKSPFRGGKGDYVREMADACRRAGMKFGVYVSPWDRNSADYGTAKYVETYHAQIKELLGGNYGEVFEMWFDGANGGDGYYGGAREKRKIPNDYYRFDEVFRFVRKLQPKVCIFAGEHDTADFRWPGNERGELDPDSRATICTVGGFANGEYGNPDYGKYINTGCAEGKFFKMCEADFPLRPGWFYHAKERGKSKHAAYLMNRYLVTVGNGGTMNIGIAPNKDGLLDEEDVKALKGFGELRKVFFANEVTDPAKPFNLVVLREDISKGEQVDDWSFLVNDEKVLSGKSIGHKRIRILDRPMTARRGVRVVVDKGTVSYRLYFVDPELVKLVQLATTDSGETDTAKWMTGIEKEKK